MRLLHVFTAIMAMSLFPAGAISQSSRHPFTVPMASGGVLAQGFGDCANPICPAVLILSGSKGFGAPAYDEIGQTFRAAGLNAYLIHVLTPTDLETIAFLARPNTSGEASPFAPSIGALLRTIITVQLWDGDAAISAAFTVNPVTRTRISSSVKYCPMHRSDELTIYGNLLINVSETRLYLLTSYRTSMLVQSDC